MASHAFWCSTWIKGVAHEKRRTHPGVAGGLESQMPLAVLEHNRDEISSFVFCSENGEVLLYKICSYERLIFLLI